MRYYKTKLDQSIVDLIDKLDLNLYMASHEDWGIPVFIAFFNNVDKLNALWEDVYNVIASGFQTNLKSQENLFQKWNLYIIYVCPDNVSKELKSKIENNKFSSRKIVESGFVGELNDEKISALIIKHITSVDLVEIVNNTVESSEVEYKPFNDSIWKLIPKEELLSRKTSLQDKIIQQLQIIKKNEN